MSTTKMILHLFTSGCPLPKRLASIKNSGGGSYTAKNSQESIVSTGMLKIFINRTVSLPPPGSNF